MKRKEVSYWIAIILSISISFFVTACMDSSSPADSSSPPTAGEIDSEQDVENLLEAGRRVSSDTDNDGINDTFTMKYDREEISQGIYVNKKIEVEEAGDESSEATLTLEFENTGDIGSYTHVEQIPKEFAESVDDLEFSIQPDRIINPDPEVEWDLKLEGFQAIGIEIKAKGKRSAVELFDAFDKAKNFRMCEKVSPGLRDICYVYAVGKLEKPTISDCDIISGFEFKETCIAAIAVKRDDPNICAENIKSPDIKAICYVGFALAKDKSFCDRIPDKAERTVCRLALEAEEKGVSFNELYRQKLNETDADPSEDVVFDLLILTDDDEYYTGRSYSFEASIDPPDKLPENPIYEFSFDDGITKKGSSSTISREFTKPGGYALTAKIYENGKVVYQKTRVFVFVKSQELEQEISLTAEDCTELGEECADTCNKICEEKKGEYCEKYPYSGCALDVFCWCNVCSIYDTKWCPNYPDYLSCAEGAKGKYRSCIENCQSKRESGGDVSTCWADCNNELNDAIIECKQGPCQSFCEDKGFDKGEWAKYTQEYGWDSCYCTNA